MNKEITASRHKERL